MSFKQSFAIGGMPVGTAAPCLIVGEIGPNHDGDPDKALRLIDACAEAGCNGVKFQYHVADAEIFDRTTKSYYYDETRFNFIKRVQELPHRVHLQLREHTRAQGLAYLCSVFSEEAIDKVAELDPDAFKLPSGEVDNPWLLEKIGSSRKPVVVSSGMSPVEEIDAMMNMLRLITDEVVLLHCVSEYPTPKNDMNLRFIPVLVARYGCLAGLSDHSRNIAEVAASVALGASIIEIHVTFDRQAKGPDHHISLLPGELKELVTRVRGLEAALGQPEKILGAHVRTMRGSFTNSIVTRRPIKAGEVLTRNNLALRKPGTGLPPSELPRVLGRKAANDLVEGVALTSEDIA